MTSNLKESAFRLNTLTKHRITPLFIISGIGIMRKGRSSQSLLAKPGFAVTTNAPINITLNVHFIQKSCRKLEEMQERAC